MPDDPKDKEAQEEREREIKERESESNKPVRTDRPLSADRPGTQYESESVDEKNDLRVKARRMSDEDRRRKDAEEAGEGEKYQVTDATPSSGGVYPPSAVVEPFPADVVSSHTPGETAPEEEARKENERSPDPQTPGALRKGTGPDTRAGEEPASATTSSEQK